MMALKINRQKDPVRAIGIRGFTLFFFKFAVVFCILVTFEVHPANSVPGTSNSNKDDDNNGGSLQATSSDLFDALNSAVETALSKNDNAQLIFLRENISSDCVSAAIGEIDNELEENFGSPEDASLTVNALAINLTSKTLISCPHFVNFRVLERSIEILGDAGEQSARIKLTKILDDSTFQGMTRGQAAIAIGKIVSPKPEKDQGVLTSLTTALSDDSWNVRSGACLAFGEWGREDMLPTLEDIFHNDEHPVVQLSCARAFMVITETQQNAPLALQFETASTLTAASSVSAESSQNEETVEEIIERIEAWFVEHVNFE